jgi:hypothetical protein
MTITTYEGVLEKGKIRLKNGVHLPDNTKVYVVVRGTKAKKTSRVNSPRLVHPRQIADFRTEVSEANFNARIRR